MPKAIDTIGPVSAPAELFRFYLQGFSSGVPITASLVISDTKYSDANGLSDGLSWEEDRLFLSALRRNSEVVLTTGKTARAENLGKPKTARLAIISNTGDLRGTKFEDDAAGAMLLSGRENSWQYLEELQQLGFERIQIEYGPKSMTETWNQGLIPLLCLSSESDPTTMDFQFAKPVFKLSIGQGVVVGFASGVATDKT